MVALLHTQRENIIYVLKKMKYIQHVRYVQIHNWYICIDIQIHWQQHKHKTFQQGFIYICTHTNKVLSLGISTQLHLDRL